MTDDSIPMNVEMARRILGISDNEVSDAAIRDRYVRLSRRYPAAEYPDKAIEIRRAFDVIQRDGSALLRLINQDRLSVDEVGIDRAELQEVAKGGFVECLSIAQRAQKDRDPNCYDSGEMRAIQAHLQELFERLHRSSR